MRVIRLVSAILISSALFAQNPDKLAPLVERIDVSDTNVDVIVTDSAGHPVPGYAGRVHIYVSIYDAGGNNVGYHHFVQDLNVDHDDYECAGRSSFRYHTVVGLKPGLFTILVTLRDDVTNEIGTATHNLRL
jgi:hypothetical protein